MAFVGPEVDLVSAKAGPCATSSSARMYRRPRRQEALKSGQADNHNEYCEKRHHHALRAITRNVQEGVAVIKRSAGRREKEASGWPSGGPLSWLQQVLRGFHDVDRHLEVILERLGDAGFEGRHVLSTIQRRGGRIGSEIEATFVNDTEELSLKREVRNRAEHRAARQTLEIGKLIQHELFVPNPTWPSTGHLRA